VRRGDDDREVAFLDGDEIRRNEFLFRGPDREGAKQRREDQRSSESLKKCAPRDGAMQRPGSGELLTRQSVYRQRALR